MYRKWRILLADDHSILRTGLKMLLATQPDFEVVAEAADGYETMKILVSRDIDIVLLDLSMPGLGGIDCLRQIKEKHLPVKVLVLTMYSEQQYIREVMALGASGYLCKDVLDTELFRALRTITLGRRYLGEDDAQRLLESFSSKENFSLAQLSGREKEVLSFLVYGYSMSVIAKKLYLSVKTVSTYKMRLMQKLGCKDNHELVEYALRHNLLDKGKNG